MDRIDCNAASLNSTRFLAATELIKKARNDFSIPSENWAYPTRYGIGMIEDAYYAEIWEDGMDWQNTYWIIEAISYDDPIVTPLIQFASHKEQDKFNYYDFSELLKAILWLRREEVWINKDDYGRFNDTIWPFLRVMSTDPNYKFFRSCYFEHASQQKVWFLLNENYIRKSIKKKEYSPIMGYASGDQEVANCPTCGMPCIKNK